MQKCDSQLTFIILLLVEIINNEICCYTILMVTYLIECWKSHLMMFFISGLCMQWKVVLANAIIVNCFIY